MGVGSGAAVAAGGCWVTRAGRGTAAGAVVGLVVGVGNSVAVGAVVGVGVAEDVNIGVGVELLHASTNVRSIVAVKRETWWQPSLRPEVKFLTMTHIAAAY